MVIVTEEIDLPIAQPKPFHRAIVSPIAAHEVQFAPQDDLTPRNKLKGAKSSGLSLSLRRVTPDRFKKDDATTPDPHHSSGASFVSRLTGKGSVYTGATPVMRGSGTHRSKSPGGIERQQKLEDEYYRPPKGGHDEDEEGQEEVLDDGELPSLSRSPSNGGSRPSSRTRSPRPVVTGFWSQDEDDEDEIDGGSNRRASEAAAILAAAAAKAASERSQAAATPQRVRDANNNMVPMNDKDFETLKVAGFWSQLDDVDTVEDDIDSEDDEDDGRLRTVHHNGYEEEEMPNDERQWRRTQSPSGRGRKATSMGLASHKSESNDTGGTSSRHTKDTGTSLDSKNKNAGNGNWNLLEKAACFASGNAAKAQEEDDVHTFDQNSANNNSDKSHEHSLDRSYQTSTSATEGEGTLNNTRTKGSNTTTTMNNTGATNHNEQEDRGMFNCLADALGAICGYSTYVSDVNVESTKNDNNTDGAKKKERALAIIERNRQRRVEGEEYSEDEATDGSSKMHPMRSFDSECDEEDHPIMSDSEDAAIELEYLSRDDNEEATNRIATRDNVVTHTVAAGVVGAAGSMATKATDNTFYSPPTEPPMSPTTEKKKKRLTVKSVQNLLGLRKKKEVASAELEPPSTAALVYVMPTPLKEQPEPDKINNNATQEAQLSIEVVDKEDMPEMIDDDSLFDEDAEEDNNVVDEETVPEDSTSGGLNKYTFNEEDTPKPRTIFDEEELESQAAGWDSNRKNSYLRELAQRAKQEYRAKKSLESHGDPDLTTALNASMGAAAVAVIRTSRGNTHDDSSRNTQENDVASRAGSQSSYNVDYNSFNPVEKRKFLRLLNSGMSPQDATRIIVDERDDMPILEDAELDAVSVDDDAEDSVATEEGSAGDLRAEQEDGYEDSDSLLSHDPLYDVLEEGRGESAEPSTRAIDEKAQDISRSEKATAGGTPQESHSDVAGFAAAVATAGPIPAIVRAKTKSKTSNLQENDKRNYNEQEVEEKYYPGADGLISVGDKYYDSLRPSYEQDDVDNALLIGKEKSNARSVSRVKKIPKRPSVSTSFAKVASRRALESPRSSSTKFTAANRNNAIPVRDDDSVDDIASPKSETRTPKFNFIHRSSKWAKLGHIDSSENDEKSIVDEEEELYSPRSVPMQVKDTKSPVSAPDDERASVSEWAHDQSPPSAATPDSPMTKPPSTAASHVALPTLLPESDDRERNVITPTNEITGSEVEMMSPDQSTAEIASGANSLFMSPDTLSPTSPQDLGSLTETPCHLNSEESFGTNRESPSHSIASPAADAHSSIARSHFRETRKKSKPINTGFIPASQMPLIPDSPHDRASLNDADQSVANYSLAEQSFVTLGTAWTTASKSSRRRHKGAAGKRLMQAKEAESHAGAKSKGWMGSIRDVAAKREQNWDPEKGWLDYSEPEVTPTGDAKPIGSLHLTQIITPRKPVHVEPQGDCRGVRVNTPVEFPKEWAAERKDIIKSAQPLSVTILESSNMDDESTNIDEKSVFTSDASTINSVDTSGLLHNTHAPARRATPKHRSAAEKRKTAAVPGKTVGWKASMEAATAHMNDESRHWDYDNGWTERQDFPDDVSELTKLTLERSPGSEAVNNNHARPIDTTSPASPAYYLPSVAEDLVESESNAQDDDEIAIGNQDVSEDMSDVKDPAVEEMNCSNHNDGGNATRNDDPERTNDDALIEDSDKENELSRINTEDSEDESPKLATEEFPLTATKPAESDNVPSHDSEKPPLPKRSLNQWLVERSLKDGTKSPDVESANAVHTPETTLDDSSGPSQLSKSLFSALDDVNVDEATTQEINVVRERCDDNDRGLFQTANDLSDIQVDSSSSRENLIMESFETMDSSEKEWLETLSPKEKDQTETDETSVSSRALAWMSSIEKKSNLSTPIYSQNRAVHATTDPTQAKSDPPQNIDPPSSLSDRATKRMIEFRYSSSTLSSQTPNVSNQRSSPSEAPKKSRVEELISKLEHPDKVTQRSYLSQREEEHDVIFHSNAMGIRLKRGEDGLVRVVSVTESSPGSSIVRDGKIEPDDIVREAAGADLRSPITNSRWGEVVLQIRNASRPMKFVIVSTRKRAEDDSHKFAKRSLPQEQNSARSPRSAKPINSPKERQPRILFGDDVSVDSSCEEDSTAKQSLFNRIASCAAPGPSNGEGNEVPMAHLAFLRTNPTIARVRNEASRRYPALCGRPDTIFEEPEDSEMSPDRTSNNRSSAMDRSATTSYDGSQTTVTVSAAQTASSGGATNATSYASGDNTAYLKGFASKSALSNKPIRSWNNSAQKLGQQSTGIGATGGSEVGWPDSDGQVYAREPDTLSASSSRSHSSFHVHKHNRDSARQAEVLAESKVVAMMEHELHHFDSAEECEI